MGIYKSFFFKVELKMRPSPLFIVSSISFDKGGMLLKMFIESMSKLSSKFRS